MLLWAVALGLLLSACDSGVTPRQELIIFAASSLTDTMDELAAEFEANHQNVSAIVNYGSSSQLAIQLLEGAQVDVFASANEAQMELVSAERALAGEPVIIARNTLVAILPADNPAQIESLSDLARPGVRLVAAGKGVPIRDYTDQALAVMRADPAFGEDFYQGFYANLVSEEDNVRRVVTKVALGEADAGIVYRSDLISAGTVQSLEIPDAFNIQAAYPLAIVKDAPHPALAQAFVDFVLSDRGQAVLNRWGFLSPDQDTDS